MMDILLLRKYESNFEKLKRTSVGEDEGLTLLEIEKLENLFNNGAKFPGSFREYLFLGGKFDTLGFNGPVNGNYEGFMKHFALKLKERNMEIKRPHIVFHHLDGESFGLIYLDEGDDPQPWNISVNEAYNHDDGSTMWKAPYPSFSDLVTTLVDRAISGQVPW
jgi:hypothetical protein